MKHYMQALQTWLQRAVQLKRDENGQILLLTALSGLALVLMVSTIYNIGMVTGDKMKVQDAADAAAYSQAVWEARQLNFLAYTNRAIVSHMVTIAFATAVLSQRELWQRIDMVASVIPPPPGPFIRAASKTLFRIWDALSRIARPTREAARVWITATRTFQFAVLSEYMVRTATQENVARRVAAGMDPRLKMNRGANVLIGAAMNAAHAKDILTLTGYPSPSKMDFKSFSETYQKSMDGFSRGSSFPRRVSAGTFPLFKVGLGGKVKVETGRIVQQERFVVGVLGYIGRCICKKWAKEWSVSVADQVYTGLKLGDMRMINAQASAVRRGDTLPSTYSYAQKNSGDIVQIKLLDSANDRNLSAFSRAEVFYWDPDRKRNTNLGKPNPKREPNLFNPFWHARLAPADDALMFLPGGIGSIVPVTH